MTLVEARRRVATNKTAYEALLLNKVADNAPLPDQHDWWRRHDSTKMLYAKSDWIYESMILRPLILAALVLAIGGVFATELLAAAVLVVVAALWRCYIVFTRHAPE
jgi:hypothetical protein